MVFSDSESVDTAAQVDVLLVEDDPADAAFCNEMLEGDSMNRYAVTHVQSLADAASALRRKGPFTIMLLDLDLSDADGLESLECMRREDGDSAIVILSGLTGEDVAVQALRRGAQDYVCKDNLEKAALVRVITQALERKKVETRQRGEHLQHQISRQGPWPFCGCRRGPASWRRCECGRTCSRRCLPAHTYSPANNRRYGSLPAPRSRWNAP